MLNNIYQLSDFFMAQVDVVTSPSFILYSKIIFIIISVGFVVGIIILLIKNSFIEDTYMKNFVEFFTYRPYGAQKTFKQWGKVVKRLETGKEGEYRMAIIEADSLLDETLRGMEYKGEKINDLLDQVDSKVLPSIDRIKSAHEFRNNIVHDPSYELTLNEAKTIIGVYEQAFRDLQMF
ncbi:hypothetical protein KKA24_01015 [Patescibacteria group bacterium]|nr:hypothetical protein [Patescibacteria group bacterium]